MFQRYRALTLRGLPPSEICDKYGVNRDTDMFQICDALPTDTVSCNTYTRSKSLKFMTCDEIEEKYGATSVSISKLSNEYI